MENSKKFLIKFCVVNLSHWQLIYQSNFEIVRHFIERDENGKTLYVLDLFGLELLIHHPVESEKNAKMRTK